MRRTAGAPLRLFNTLGGRLQEFSSLEPGATRMYTCGPTVYAYQHIGNLRAYVFADTLRRALEWKGHRVVQAISITDVGHLTSDMDDGQDKLELASNREHRSVWDIAAHYTDVFMHDLEELRVRPPAVWARATDHVEDMIVLARALESGGYTYELPSGLYFDTRKVPDYGKLARLDLNGIREGARIPPVPGKRHLADFALWRASPKDVRRLMEWDSPWGRGAPGWHLECSAMSMKYLGERFDLHTGGIDHVPVHHTNEIAQSEAYLGGPWVPFWIHNEFINLRHAKISKSRGGALLLGELKRRGFHPLTYRYLLLGSRYRNQMEFTWDGLAGARVAHRRLLERIRGRLPADGRPLNCAEAADRLADAGLSHLERLDQAVSADLNTAHVIAMLTQLSRDPELPARELAALVSAAEALLAIGLLDLAPEDLDVTDTSPEPQEVEILIRERATARRRGDFATADGIRDRLNRMGIELRDTPVGTTWQVQPPARHPPQN